MSGYAYDFGLLDVGINGTGVQITSDIATNLIYTDYSKTNMDVVLLYTIMSPSEARQLAKMLVKAANIAEYKARFQEVNE